ncbi:hypothetical protein [Burkholderia sp. NRF60-BP8]|uniref:hypothetical protein n=1 Tax=Burkholderia sp. NRF60-BP8 TaxID=1637853 RepID=UPI00131F00CE|nr:hypothetical protein [Burkholderia sp. NRF60-BP8]
MVAGSAFTRFPFFTIGSPNRLHRIGDGTWRASIASRRHARRHDLPRSYFRIHRTPPIRRHPPPPGVPPHRNNYKIKVDQIKSLIQVNNSFKFFCDLDLTCVTGCLIFDNPKTASIP